MLTDARIRNIKHTQTTQRLTDGSGLYLAASLKAGRYWRWRFRQAGKENIYSVGEFCAGENRFQQEITDAQRKRPRPGRLLGHRDPLTSRPGE